MFLIGNQKPAVKTVFGSFLDKDEHEKNRRHHIYPRCLLLCWCAAGRTSQTKNCDMFCCFPRWLFTTQTKTKMFRNDFPQFSKFDWKHMVFTVFSKKLSKHVPRHGFSAVGPVCARKNMVFTACQKNKRWVLQVPVFFSCVLERRDNKTWGQGGGTKASRAGAGW